MLHCWAIFSPLTGNLGILMNCLAHVFTQSENWTSDPEVILWCFCVCKSFCLPLKKKNEMITTLTQLGYFWVIWESGHLTSNTGLSNAQCTNQIWLLWSYSRLGQAKSGIMWWLKKCELPLLLKSSTPCFPHRGPELHHATPWLFNEWSMSESWSLSPH